MWRLRKGDLKNIFLVVSFIALIVSAVINLESLWKFLGQILSVASPVITGLAIAYILNVLMRGFENYVLKFMKKSKRKFVRGMLRPLALILTIVVFLGIITVLIAVVWPDVEETVISLSGKLPAYFNDLKEWGIKTLENFNFDSAWLEEFTIDWKAITTAVQSIFDSDSTSAIIGGASSFVGSVAGSVLNLGFSFVIAIYFLAQKERIGAFSVRVFRSFLPDKISEKFFHVTDICHSIFSNFIRVQCIEAVIFGVLCYIGMLIFRFPYAGIISIVVGCTALVPIIGALIGEIFGAVLILTVNPWQALLFLVFVLVLQQLEGSLIYPKVVGTSVGLPGILVFSAVIIGGNIGGIIYSLLSVPICAVLYTLLKEKMAARASEKEAAPQMPLEETGTPDSAPKA